MAPTVSVVSACTTFYERRVWRGAAGYAPESLGCCSKTPEKCFVNAVQKLVTFLPTQTQYICVCVGKGVTNFRTALTKMFFGVL